MEVFGLLATTALPRALIQRRGALTERDLQVAFTLQQLFATVVVVVIVIAAPWIVAIYPDAPPDMVWVVRALALSLYLVSWRMLSAARLERELRFDRLVRVEVGESLLYQGLAVGLAFAGFGVWSFIIAALVRAAAGSVAIYLSAPWPIRLTLPRRGAVEWFRAGLPFQVQDLVQATGDWVTPVLVGAVGGVSKVGYLTWAGVNGRKPLVFVGSIVRVAFPHIARAAEHEPHRVERLLDRYFTYLIGVCAAWSVTIAVAGPALVEVIYTDKWTPAVLALVLYSAALPADAAFVMCEAALNGMGRTGLGTRGIAVHQFTFLAVTVPLVLLVGYNGVPIGYLIALGVSLPVVFAGLGAMSVRIGRRLLWLTGPIGSSLALGLLVREAGLSPTAQAIVLPPLVLSVYAIVAWLLCPSWVRADLAGMLRRRFSTGSRRIRAAQADAALADDAKPETVP